MTDEQREPLATRTKIYLAYNHVDEIDVEALEVLKAFCADPLSASTGSLIDEYVARRERRAALRVVK